MKLTKHQDYETKNEIDIHNYYHIISYDHIIIMKLKHDIKCQNYDIAMKVN